MPRVLQNRHFEQSLSNPLDTGYNPLNNPSFFLPKNIEIALSDLTGKNGAIWFKIDGPVKGDILVELLSWVSKIPIYSCFKFEPGLYNKLLKKGWDINGKNMHCLHKDTIYARFVYNYVVFGTFLNGHDSYEEDGAQLLFKTKLNRIKQIEKRYKNK
mgnify:CR=1 FL=1